MSRARLAAAALAGVAFAGAALSTASAAAQPATAGPLRARGAPTVTTVATGLVIPWEIAFLPDRRALITERPGRVRVMTRDRRLLATPAATIPVAPAGLLGLALDPDFPRNHFVYLYRTTPTGNQLLRYRMLGARLVAPRLVAPAGPPGGSHDGGRIHFGPDRWLYVSTGDAGNPPLAQDRASLAGKLLRLSPAAYRGSRPVRPEVFSLGHRNPQGFDWQPGTDSLVATDHGDLGMDEVNLVRRGGNHGWPSVVGATRRRGFASPAVLFPPPIAPSGATFVALPGSRWTGDLLVATLRGQHIRRIRLRGARAVIDQPLFAGRYGRVRTVVEGPDGALYALTSNRDGRGTVRAGDDRVLRIVPPAR